MDRALARNMTRNRSMAAATAGPKRFRGRRFSQRRTPQDGVRAAAAWVLERTEASLAPASVFLESATKRCDRRDHGLLRELSLGSLRWRRRLDHVISRASNRSFQDIEPALRAPLRLAAYQLLFLDRIPPHAAVHEAVEQARRLTHRGGASFTNAVLRRIARSRSLEEWPVEVKGEIRRLGIEHSHPDFLVRRWVDRLGMEKALALLGANNRPKPMHLLAFKDRGGRETLAEALIEADLDVQPSLLSPLGLLVEEGNPLALDAFHGGDFYIQDEASQAAALLPPPRPGERIFDAAAAPGGKSFSLLAHEPDLRLTLADVSLERLGLLASNLRRLRRSLPLVLADAARPPLHGPFDRVILDLPCTGTGTLRKHPELKWRISEGEIGRLARQARRMLRGCAPLVAPGGVLVAITCSLELEENEGVVEGFLREHGEFAPAHLEDLLDLPLVRHVEGPGRWRLLPSDGHDGFTVHVLTRNA